MTSLIALSHGFDSLGRWLLAGTVSCVLINCAWAQTQSPPANPVPSEKDLARIPLQAPKDEPSKEGPNLGGIPLQIPQEASGRNVPSVGGIPLQMPRDELGAEPVIETGVALRPMGDRMGGAGRIVGQRGETFQQAPLADPLTLPVDDGGYYPTQIESPILGGGNADYPRLRGDRGYWGYSGIWPVRPAPDNFYQRNGAFFDRVERGLRTFIPGQNALAHSLQTDLWSVDLNYALPGLTEDLAEDRVMLKLGPLYLDVLGVSASALYTNYSGDVPLQGVPSEGWISILGIPVRAALRLTDTVYFQVSGFFYYLPGENEFGMSSGLGTGWAVGTNARLNFEWECQPWLFRAYDYFGFVNSLADAYEPWEVDEIDAVGRYRFGTEGFGGGDDPDSYWDPRFGGYRNDVGFEAQRPFDESEWWFLASVVHSDYWAQADLDDHSHADQINLLLAYMGDDWMFAPSFGYRMTSTDYFESMTHEIYARFAGRLTEYLTSFGQVGYLWQTGDDTSLEDGTVTWEVGLNHDLTTYTRHSLSGGQVYTLSEQLNEYLAEYVRYTITHSCSQRLTVNGYIQYEDSENLSDGTTFTGARVGTSARYIFGEDVGLTAGVAYYTNEEPTTGPDREGWLYYASLQRPLLSRLHGSAAYQYVDERGPIGSNFTEHLLILSLNFAF